MNRTIDVFTATLGLVTRGGAGIRATRGAVTPEKLIELYEYEGSPHCRKVREALTALDLDAMIYPCPRGGTVHRPRMRELGGKELFPFLVDPNTGRKLYESADIVEYLFAEYGDGRPPLGLRLGPLVTATSFLATAVRPLSGMKARPARQPPRPLELYSFEASPYCRLVRETLCELEIAYRLHNLGKTGAVDYLLPGLRARFARGVPYTTEKRRAFAARTGKVSLPYLVDPNTGVEMFESADIKQYLLETYAE